MTLFTVFFTASCFRYLSSARRGFYIMRAQRWQVQQQRLGANLANGIVSSASYVSKRQKMTPIMAGASCDFLVLCLYTAPARTACSDPGCVRAPNQVTLHPVILHGWFCRFMAESRWDSKCVNWQTNGPFEQSFALYSKLVHTRACAAFMAPPWIWCKDHFIWCCIVTGPRLDSIYGNYPCDNFAMYLLCCSKYFDGIVSIM